MATHHLPPVIAPVLLTDLRAAASFLDEIAEEASWPNTSRAAHQHAVRLWAAVQAVERLLADQGTVTPGVAP
jgi:hypothetical protein